MPKNWPNFLQNENNKKELYPFLADSLKEADPQNLVFVSKEDGAIANVDACSHLTMNLSCNPEEADTRLFVHVHHAIKHSAIKTVTVLSNDIDIVVLAVAVFADLQQDGLQKLCVAFGQLNKRRWMPIHTLFEKLGKEKSRALMFFHAFSGCDNVSGFKGKGKTMLFETWSSFPDATQTFMKLSSQPQMVNSHDLDVLEKFTVMLYDRSSSESNVDSARHTLFTQKNRPYDKIPPTRAALFQHVLRAAYQAGYIWGQALVPHARLPHPNEWGWKEGENGTLYVHWTDNNPIADVCHALKKCGCKNECSGRCTCKRTRLPCTSLCTCPCEH